MLIKSSVNTNLAAQLKVNIFGCANFVRFVNPENPSRGKLGDQDSKRKSTINMK